MDKTFADILTIARENVRKNPSLQGRPPDEVALQYLKGLKDEVSEVTEEVRTSNRVYLEDELSDIAWDYACVLAQLELCGYITCVEAVLDHGYDKYKERAPAFLEGNQTLWDSIKQSQKSGLRERHQNTYGE